MQNNIDAQLQAHGLVLPVPAKAVANYVPAIISDNLLYISGQLCLDGEGKLFATGKCGQEVDIATGKEAAKWCALNVLSQAKAELGSLDKISKCLRLGGFIHAAPDFYDVAQVMNGASDLMTDVFGENGKHIRATVGVATLPLNAAVEVEALFEIKA